jgi:aspartate/glutamate racemase
MLFLHFFSLDIISTNYQNVPMDAKRHVIVTSTNSTMTKSTINSTMLESSLDILDPDFDQYSLI